MRRSVTILTLLLSWVFTQAQPTTKKDSLLNVLTTAKEDTSKVITLLKLAKHYESNDHDSSIYYLEQAKKLSESLKFVKGLYWYYDQKSIVSFTNGEYDLSMEENFKGLALARQLKDSSLVVVMLNHIGIVYGLQQKFQEQLDYGLQVVGVYEKLKDSSRLSQSFHNLANCYLNLTQYRKAVSYCLASVALYTRYKKRNDYINRAYSTLAQGYQGLQMGDSALYYYDIAIRESAKSNDKYAEAAIYGYKSTLLLELNRFADMLPVSQQSLVLARELENRQMTAAALVSTASAYFYNGQNTAARKDVDEALAIAIEDSMTVEMTNAYVILGYIAAKEGDYATVVSAEKKYDSLYKSVMNEEMIQSTTELEKKYETEKKNVQLKLQKAQIQRKTTLNTILIGSAIVLLLFSLLTYRSYRQKQRLHQQRIRELEKDRQLVAVDSLLKGQEEERSRLAKDLHDGLGGLLSGVKFSLSNMKDNLIITPDNMNVFERSLDMIDTSIKELRRVAHNMMPEMLVKFGLNEGLKEYCNSVNATKLIAVKYQSFGMEERIDSSKESMIYRIVQELLNNTLKHAGATEALVQLIKEKDRLSVLVEDNGKGFDIATLEKNKGAGWTSIYSRVEYLQGQLDIHSEHGKGTSVTIDINV